ncbi:MAG TPA: hypothetical protein VMD78_02985 [Candidatus Baltobacteraceae bacterium]|nr:hypothetical protein [Candidatus Baltobacteraceae bacterium]
MNRVVALMCCLLAFIAPAIAKLTSGFDYRVGILDADLVCIVSQQAPDVFKVDEVFLATGPAVETIRLPGFQLATEQKYGPDIVEPITPNTRILMYLRRKKDAPSSWEVLDYGLSFSWVQNPEQTQQLRSFAEKGVDLRRRFEAASDIRDPLRRTTALWPFLDMTACGPEVARRAEEFLKSAAPVSGDYFAEHFDKLPYDQRMDLLRDAGEYGGDRLHETVKEFISEQEKIFDDYASANKLGDELNQKQWYSLPPHVSDSTGYVYYGAAGLAKYHNREDLPVFREIGMWGVKYGMDQPSEAALDAFRDMPDEENLPVIAAIRERFKRGTYGVITDQPDGLLKFETLQALETHIYVKSIPQLVPFLEDDRFSEEAENTLTKIVGRDLGQKSGPWLAWYEAH